MKQATGALAIRDSETSLFLNALCAGKPDELYLLIWTLQGERKRSHWFSNVQQAIAHIAALHGCNVYAGIGLSPSDFGEFKRCESENVAGIVGFCVDIDLKSDAHPKGARPATIEQALSILPPEFSPSIIVETGNGIQVWWLFKEPLIFDNEAERQKAATLSLRWQTLLKYAAQRHGWAFERLGDLARVLRVPGTQNLKNPADPKNVVIRTFTECRYNASDFRDYLDDLSIPSEDEQAQEAKNWAEHFSDKSLLIRMAAAIPDGLLAGWLEEDPRFRCTWNHQRDDMSDQTQSGYDQSLAHFGVRKGLADQQIVELIIHNRRLHGAKQSNSLDYYRRTLSKARSGAGKTPLAAGEIAASDPGNPLSARASVLSPDACIPVPGRAADPNQKAKLCDRISAILGVVVLRIEKLRGSEPVFLMELESGCIEFPDVGKLLSLKFLREVLAANAGKIIRKFRGPEWDQLAQMMLDACVEKQGTDDLEFKGVARIHITRYLSENPAVIAIERLTGPNGYGPLIVDGRIAISSMDLQIYINKTTMQNLSVKRVATMISVLGGEAIRIRKNSFREQSRWALPASEWDPNTYSAGSGEFANGQ